MVCHVESRSPRIARGLLAMESLCAVTLAPSSSHAQAQKYPNRPIKLIVPVPPGGAVDLLARSIGGGSSTPTRRQIEIIRAWGINYILGFPAYL